MTTQPPNPHSTDTQDELGNLLIKCPDCNGDGFTSEHEPGCNGNCNNCPVQAQCERCHAHGYFADKQEVAQLVNAEALKLLDRLEEQVPSIQDEHPTDEEGKPVETYGYEEQHNSLCKNFLSALQEERKKYDQHI